MADQNDQGLIHREMARVSQNVHRVSNPTNEDFRLVWDQYVEIIPAHGTADLPTYKTEKYLKEMSARILMKRQDEAVEAENQRRSSRGEKPMDKFQGGDQPVLEGRFSVESGLGNPQVVAEVYKELYVGLVREYGVHVQEKQVEKATPSTHEQIIAELFNSQPIGDDTQPPILDKPVDDQSQSPLESLKQPELRKLAREKGIPESKTDKKDELIAKISQAA